MPLCVQCPRTYPRDAFRLIDAAGNQLAEPRPSLLDRLSRLLERTPPLAPPRREPPGRPGPRPAAARRGLALPGRTRAAGRLPRRQAGRDRPDRTDRHDQVQLSGQPALPADQPRHPERDGAAVLDHRRAVPAPLGAVLRGAAAQPPRPGHHPATERGRADPAARRADDGDAARRPGRPLRPGVLRLRRRGPADRPGRSRAQPVRAADGRRAAVLHAEGAALPARGLPAAGRGAVADRPGPEPGGRHLHHPAGPAQPAPRATSAGTPPGTCRSRPCCPRPTSWSTCCPGVRGRGVRQPGAGRQLLRRPAGQPGGPGPAAVRDHPPLRRGRHPAGHRTAVPAADLPRGVGDGM